MENSIESEKERIAEIVRISYQKLADKLTDKKIQEEIAESCREALVRSCDKLGITYKPGTVVAHQLWSAMGWREKVAWLALNKIYPKAGNELRSLFVSTNRLLEERHEQDLEEGEEAEPAQQVTLPNYLQTNPREIVRILAKVSCPPFRYLTAELTMKDGKIE